MTISTYMHWQSKFSRVGLTIFLKIGITKTQFKTLVLPNIGSVYIKYKVLSHYTIDDALAEQWSLT